jgi:DNA-binding PadR family transcriptional regulator
MGADYPGEFEHMLMLVILQLGDDAYGGRVRGQLTELVGREPSAGALYTTLQRLELKGWVSGRQAVGSTESGGRPRRYFRVAAEGIAALRRSRTALLTLWEPVAGALDEA